MPKLVVIRGPTTGLEYPIKDNVIVGRDPRCQILIGHREVSAQHARVARVGDRYYLEDLNSRNGTFVNERQIQRHPLNDGDEVRVGRTTFRFDARPLPGASVKETAEHGSMTLELDATRDVFPLSGAPVGGPRKLEHTLKMLCNVSRTIGSLSGLKTTLDEIAATLLEVFPQTGRVIILLRSDGEGLEPVVTRWRSDPAGRASTYSETIVKKALSEKRAILTVDALSDDRFAASQSVVDLRLRSLMCVPILHREQVLGVVELDTLGSTRMFTEEDLNLLTAVVAQLAFAVANAQLYDELRGMVDSTVSALTLALGVKSPSALAHSERVSRFAMAMARRLELGPAEVETLRVASLLHDIGLLAMPDTLLQPPDTAFTPRQESRLDDLTWATLRTHPQKGAEILAPLKPLAQVVDIVLAHHERYDGQGYPRGLAGSEIPLGARLIAVVDAFDGMTAAGYYQPARTPEAALEVLRTEAGKQFDPEMVALFTQIWNARMRLEARRGM